MTDPTAAMRVAPDVAVLPYVPRVLLRHLVRSPDAQVQAIDGTCVFVDVTGFTRLSERLARRGGQEGAEQLADAIGRCFASLLEVAWATGGGLLKFGGDALLLLFEEADHARRAADAAIAMRARLREVGRIDLGRTRMRLRMSVGVHSAEYHLFLVGTSHRELLIAGPAATEVVRMGSVARPGEIVVSQATAARLPASRLGALVGPGRLLRPTAEPGETAPEEREWAPEVSLISGSLSTEVRAHVLAGAQPPEHRTVTVAFLRLGDTDALIAARGPDAAAAVLGDLVNRVQAAADERQLCFLGSDVDEDAVKIILTAGAPRALGDEEERMLLALRRIVNEGSPLPLRIGVHRGPLFAGDIGPPHRRTYTVMGDVVNLAARLMAKAPPGEVYATADVLERSSTRFATAELEPFAVKGKLAPVQAVSVGEVVGGRGHADRVSVRFPLVGRERERGLVEDALDDARRGRGRLVELVGEPGMGKSRLMEEVRDRDVGVQILSATCEAYAASTPYRTWRELLRQVVGVEWETPDAEVLEALRRRLEADDPRLLPWLPLLATAFDVEAPPTPEVDQLALEFRRTRLHEMVLGFLRRQLPGWALIQVEDVHLMDEASADLLRALAEELPLLPWLVVVSRRDRDSGFAAAPGPHLVHVELEPLEPDQALALATAVTEASPLPPHVVRLIAERSGGNPQFLRDLLRAADSGASELPDSMEAAALARLDRLPPADRALVRRASVLGLSFHPRFLDSVLDPETPAPDAATWQRLEAYFAQDEDRWLRFRRQLVRDVAYAGLPFRVRRELHAAVAARLERELGEAAEDEAEQLSMHFLLAEQHPHAYRYAVLAAERARSRYAYADATVLYRRALEAGRHVEAGAEAVADLWEALADAHTRTGEIDAAARALTTARRLVGGDPVRTGHLLWMHARLAERVGRVAASVRWAGRALRCLQGLDDDRARACRAHVMCTLAAVRQRQGHTEQAVALAREAIVAAEEAGEETALGYACQILDWALVESGRPGEAGHSGRALEIFRRLGHVDREAVVLNNLGGFAYRAGNWAEAVSLYRRGADASERAGDLGDAAYGDCNVGEVLSDQGRLDEAEPLLRRALRTWRGTADEHGVAFATALLGRLLGRDGRVEEGRAALEEARRSLEALGVGSDGALVRALLAESALFAGRPDEARERAGALLSETPVEPLLVPLLHLIRGVGLAELDDRAEAAGALEASLASARGHGLRYETAVALDALEQLGPGSSQRRAERDGLLYTLGVLRVPGPRIGAAIG